MKACEEYLEKDKAVITDPKSFRDGWRESLEYIINEAIERVDGLSFEESLTRIVYEE